MGFFRELPNLLYQSPLSSRTAADEYIEVKNLFRRVKLRDDLQNVFTVFNKYEIVEGARPDTVAEEIYGDSELDWVVLITAGIVNVRDEWPLSDRDLYDYAERIYGNDINATHHFETTEVKDSRGRLILPAGKVVDSDFTITYFDVQNTSGYNVLTQEYIAADDAEKAVIESQGRKYEIGYIKVNPTTGISNYIFETRKNDAKRSIFLLKPSYLQQFLNDMRDIMTYQRSSQYVDSRLIKTENTRNTIL